MTFGEKVQRLRKQQGWSQEELAERIPISRQAVSKWESGAAVPDVENVVALGKLFGVSTDYLLHDDYDADADIPAVQHREEELKKQHNRDRAMIILIGAQALGLFWQLMGSLVYQNHLIPLIGMTAHIMTIIGFEAGFQREKKLLGEVEPAALDCRRVFYRVSVWMVSLFPIAFLTRIFWAFWPRPHLSILETVSPLVVYLPVCLLSTWALRKKSS